MSDIDPLIVSAARRASADSEVRVVTRGKRGALGTSAAGFVREYDEALRLHEQTVRQQVAERLGALANELVASDQFWRGYIEAAHDAARIARGGEA